MKQKLSWCALALGLLLLSGCGQQQQHSMDYIGSEQAKTLALQDAGLTAAGTTFSDIVLDQRNGLDYYRVEFSAQGQTYAYDIDALTGVVIEGTSQPATPSQEVVSAIASASPSHSESSSQDAENGHAAPSGSVITAEDAKSRALSHAGLTAEQVNFVKTKLDWEKGRQCYDVEFYTQDAKEYDYEIDAVTGEVISYDYDADSYSSSAATGSSITAEQAKAIALEQVPGAAAGDIREFETDYDDGRLVYEGKIIYDSREYEFEIDGYSGAIRSWESDPVKS